MDTLTRDSSNQTKKKMALSMCNIQACCGGAVVRECRTATSAFLCLFPLLCSHGETFRTSLLSACLCEGDGAILLVAFTTTHLSHWCLRAALDPALFVTFRCVFTYPFLFFSHPQRYKADFLPPLLFVCTWVLARHLTMCGADDHADGQQLRSGAA